MRRCSGSRGPGAAVVVLLAVILSGAGAGCGQKEEPPAPPVEARPGPDPGADLAAARRGFSTRLRHRGPAPQEYEAHTPPAGVREVRYPSGELSLLGWISAEPADGKKRPAVVFLHGGFAFAPEDWADAEPFARAGFVLFMPMLRGENGNPGSYEAFWGEVDDALAAGQYVASLPYVDADNVFVAGHSVGGTLTILTAMMPSPYRAASALSAAPDMTRWLAGLDSSIRVFDTGNPDETRLRDPMSFVGSLRCPLYLYFERRASFDNQQFAEKARQRGKKCEAVLVPGDHSSMVAPAVRQSIERFRRHMSDGPRD
jgi:dipeptidyl aminopeptidase/acylaminoacyl peptidase